MKTSWGQRKNRRAFAQQQLIAELRRPQATTDDGRLAEEPKEANGAVLCGLDLSQADLRMAHLQRVDLRNAVLNNAQLDGADLSWADLDGAQLRNVTFGRARLLDATFHNADLTECDFTDATGLTPATVRGAASTKGVRWPDGFEPAEPRVMGSILHKSP